MEKGRGVTPLVSSESNRDGRMRPHLRFVRGGSGWDGQPMVTKAGGVSCQEVKHRVSPHGGRDGGHFPCASGRPSKPSISRLIHSSGIFTQWTWGTGSTPRDYISEKAAREHMLAGRLSRTRCPPLIARSPPAALNAEIKSRHSINQNIIAFSLRSSTQSSLIYLSRKKKDKNFHEIQPVSNHNWFHFIIEQVCKLQTLQKLIDHLFCSILFC